MELHQLRYFCAVARAGSFTRAAETENVSQPSLSEAIRRLEDELGAPLFQRLGRGIRLTAEGERFLPHAQQVIRGVTDARRSVENSAQPSGKLTVGCIPTIMPYLLAPNLPGFVSQFPHVDLELIEDMTARLIERLQTGGIDLAVLALPIKNPDIVVSELFREPLYLATPPDHPLSHTKVADVGDIRNDRILLLREGHCLREDVLSVCRKAKLPLTSRFETDHLTSILSLVASGFGVGLIPSMAVPHAEGCALIRLSPAGERRVGYARLRSAATGGAGKAFIRWLRTIRPPADAVA